MIKLEDREVHLLYSALTLAKNFYQEKGMKEEAEQHEALFDLLFSTSVIHVEFGQGLTEFQFK